MEISNFPNKRFYATEELIWCFYGGDVQKNSTHKLIRVFCLMLFGVISKLLSEIIRCSAHLSLLEEKIEENYTRFTDSRTISQSLEKKNSKVEIVISFVREVFLKRECTMKKYQGLFNLDKIKCYTRQKQGQLSNTIHCLFKKYIL